MRPGLMWCSLNREGISVPLMCLQCDTAACEKVCPTGALKRNESTGALVVDDAKCIRCKMCVQACPFGNIAYDPAKNRILRCDLCDGDPSVLSSVLVELSPM